MNGRITAPTLRSGRLSATRLPAMSDVALLAKVSAQTVSRVLAAHPHVSSQTRARVLAAVEQLGYRPNGAARALATGRTRTLGVFTLETNSYSRATVHHGIEVAAREAGYFVSTASAPELSPRSAVKAISWLIDQRVDGFIVAVPLADVHQSIDELIGNLPCLVIDSSRHPTADIVGVDQYRAGRLATEHLLGLGHDTVWHLAGPANWSDSTLRTEGWRDALRDAGRSIPPIVYGDWTAESGHRNGLVLGRAPEVSAVFVACDDMAFGFLRAMSELGRRVPQDVAVVGMDDIDLAAYCTPPLTTVRQQFADVGRLAVEQLIARITGPKSEQATELIEPELIVRGSSVPA